MRADVSGIVYTLPEILRLHRRSSLECRIDRFVEKCQASTASDFLSELGRGKSLHLL